MTTNTNFKYLPNYIIILLLLLTSGYLNTVITKPLLKIDKQQSALNFNDNLVRIISTGQNRLISSFLWIATLLESDLDHYKKKDLNSWMYLRFNSITNYDPLFLRAYQFGGQYLNIVKDDLIGSKKIFDKGLALYPNDYELIFNSAFLHAFELSDYKRAVSLYKKIEDHPKSPSYIKSLIARIQFEVTEDPKQVLEILQEMYKNESEETILRKRLKDDIYALKADIDLKCLNFNLKNCNLVDANGEPYIMREKKYFAPKPYTPYRRFQSK